MFEKRQRDMSCDSHGGFLRASPMSKCQTEAVAVKQQATGPFFDNLAVRLLVMHIAYA
jgi:hypothetical protein